MTFFRSMDEERDLLLDYLNGLIKQVNLQIEDVEKEYQKELDQIDKEFLIKEEKIKGESNKTLKNVSNFQTNPKRLNSPKSTRKKDSISPNSSPRSSIICSSRKLASKDLSSKTRKTQLT